MRLAGVGMDEEVAAYLAARKRRFPRAGGAGVAEPDTGPGKETKVGKPVEEKRWRRGGQKDDCQQQDHRRERQSARDALIDRCEAELLVSALRHLIK
jgi:hypothetical protein